MYHLLHGTADKRFYVLDMINMSNKKTVRYPMTRISTNNT